MQTRESLVCVVILAQNAEIHGEGDSQHQHHNQYVSHQGFVNQNLGTADNQSNPGLG